MSSSSSSATTVAITSERELPMLAAIGGAIRWTEELAAILSGPLLTAGLGIALVALLTDGQLLVAAPWLLWCWAVSQAVGVDAQIVGSSAKLARAARQGRWHIALAYGALIIALGYVAYLASNVFATQQAQGITTAQALQRLGMDSTSWIVQRSSLSVLLVVLSGMLRYTPPAARQLTADEMLAQARLKAAQAEANAIVREAQVRGMGSTALAARQVAGKVLKGAQSTDENDPHDDGPNGGGTPQSGAGGGYHSYGVAGDTATLTDALLDSGQRQAIRNGAVRSASAQSSTQRRAPLSVRERVRQTGMVSASDLTDLLSIGPTQARNYLNAPQLKARQMRVGGRTVVTLDDALAFFDLTRGEGGSAEAREHGRTLRKAVAPRRSSGVRGAHRSDGATRGPVLGTASVDREGWRVLSAQDGVDDEAHRSEMLANA